MKIEIPSYTTLSGRPLTILRMIQDAQFFSEQTPADLETFILDLRQNIWRVFGIGIDVQGTTIEERAESLLREMDKHNIIKILKED